VRVVEKQQVRWEAKGRQGRSASLDVRRVRWGACGNVESGIQYSTAGIMSGSGILVVFLNSIDITSEQVRQWQSMGALDEQGADTVA